jgi:hypothetical protein
VNQNKRNYISLQIRHEVIKMIDSGVKSGDITKKYYLKNRSILLTIK